MTLLRVAALAALPLALSAPIAAQPAPQGSAQTILVWSFGFSPHPIQLAAGRPVTLAFVNRSGSSHDFTAKTFFGTSRILRGDAADGEVELKPYETKVVTLVPRAGTYTAHCSHFMHSMLGMSDKIIVS
jgi:plastocyanin